MECLSARCTAQPAWPDCSPGVSSFNLKQTQYISLSRLRQFYNSDPIPSISNCWYRYVFKNHLFHFHFSLNLRNKQCCASGFGRFRTSETGSGNWSSEMIPIALFGWQNNVLKFWLIAIFVSRKMLLKLRRLQLQKKVPVNKWPENNLSQDPGEDVLRCRIRQK
jgi:hypothetical protein